MDDECDCNSCQGPRNYRQLSGYKGHVYYDPNFWRVGAVYLDGMKMEYALTYNIDEGWVDVYVFNHSGNLQHGRDEQALMWRRRGTVEVERTW